MSFVTVAPNEPSPLDQVIRHWNPTWKMTRSEIVGMISHQSICIVNAQNIHRHLLCGEGPRRVELVGATPPWKMAVVFWRDKAKPGGYLDNVAMTSFVDHESDGRFGVLTALTVSREMFKGSSRFTIPTGGFVAIIDKASGRPLSYPLIAGFHDDDAIKLLSNTFTWFIGSTASSEKIAKLVSVHKSDPSFGVSWRQDTDRDMSLIFETFKFANCRNVIQRDRGALHVPPKWRTEGHPRLRYRVLAIDGKLSPRSEPSGNRTDRKLSLHIVRGHFARYTPEKPLFGKYVGQFWMPQHTRGSADVGTVVKDYSVGPKPN